MDAEHLRAVHTPLKERYKETAQAALIQLASLLRLTERYCVIYRTLKNPPPISVIWSAASSRPSSNG
jgi:hypothetical protein